MTAVSKEHSRYLQLVDEIRRHDIAYYVQAAPDVSDVAYDRLYRQLKDIEAAHPEWMVPDSPTQKVGGQPLLEFSQIQHRVPMQSLDNTYTREELAEFLERIYKQLGRTDLDFVVEPKVDGVAVSLRCNTLAPRFFDNSTVRSAYSVLPLASSFQTMTIAMQRARPIMMRPIMYSG